MIAEIKIRNKFNEIDRLNDELSSITKQVELLLKQLDNIKAELIGDNDIEITDPDKGVILTNGTTRYRVGVDSSGNLTTTAL